MTETTSCKEGKHNWNRIFGIGEAYCLDCGIEKKHEVLQ